jgi:hypothetical protein
MDAPASPDTRLDFGQAFAFPFSPRAFAGQHLMNLLLLAVCFLIPIVGPLVILGYGVLVEKALIQDPLGPVPRFDFSNFGKYLAMGVYPFVTALILIPIWIALFAAIFIPMIFLLASVHAQDALLILGIACAYLLSFLSLFLLNIFFWPITMRAALEQRIGGALKLDFLLAFHRRVWAQELKYALLTVLLMPLLFPLSCIPFVSYFLGAFFVTFGWHVGAQLYRIYLARGGFPLEFTPITVDLAPAFPVQQPDTLTSPGSPATTPPGAGPTSP